jgi:hypothetical protein
MSNCFLLQPKGAISTNFRLAIIRRYLLGEMPSPRLRVISWATAYNSPDTIRNVAQVQLVFKSEQVIYSF